MTTETVEELHERMQKQHCRNCKHAGWDPDGNYCAAPKVLLKHNHGLAIPTAILHDDFCGISRKELFEAKDEK